MAITKYADPKRPSLAHFEDAMGNYLYSKPITREEVRLWERVNSHEVDETFYQDEKTQPTSTHTDHIQLWTTQEEGIAPSIAYLAAPNYSAEGSAACLRVQVELTRKELEHRGAAVEIPVVQLAVGYCHPDILASYAVKISAKQTTRQNWLAGIWKTVQFRLMKKGIPKRFGASFSLIETLHPDVIGNPNTLRLLMMMYSEFWERGGYSDEAKKSDIDAFVIMPPSSRSAFGSKYRRMEFKISRS